MIFLSVVPANNALGYNASLTLTGPSRTFQIIPSSSAYVINLESRCPSAGVVITGFGGYYSHQLGCGFGLSFNFNYSLQLGECIEVRVGNAMTGNTIAFLGSCSLGSPPASGLLCTSGSSGSFSNYSCSFSVPSWQCPVSPPYITNLGVDLVRVSSTPQELLGSRTFNISPP
jgi:hypothetical protein